ncbi:MAG: choice-of-anchor B family protein [Rhodothermales bacterium]|nr:choice-of-anchor B family protein [Rhodothermales bacterium]
MHRFLFSALILILASSPATAQTKFSDNTSALLGFGGTIAVADGEVYIGSAPISWPSGSDPAGQVYRYARNAQGQWVETGRIGASDGAHGDEFGRSLLVHGDRMIVGAPGVEAIYLYKHMDGEWTEQAKVSPAEGLADGFEFGGAYARGGYRTQTITLARSTVMVTAFNADDAAGSVHYVHEMDGAWHDMGPVIDAPVWSLVSEDDLLFAGTPQSNDGKGGVLVYDISNNQSPELVAELGSDDLSDNAQLGRSVVVHEGRLFAGAIGHEQDGVVIVYEKDESATWNRIAMIEEAEPAEGESKSGQFGGRLAISGSDLVVGARGSVFIFNTDNLEGPYSKLEAPADQKGRGFGVGLAIEGDILAVGAPSADFESGRATIYERDDAGEWALVAAVENDVNRFESMSGDMVECEDGMANDIFPCDNVDLLSMISTGDLANDRGATLNDIWGWEDSQTGKEYVLAGRTDGVSFIDISNPGQPMVVGQLMRTAGTPGSWWRDIKVYKDHAFIVADGARDHGMQIFDLGQLRDVDPADMPVDFQESAHYSGIASSHNIIINEESGFAYAIGSRAGGEGCGGQLHMMDIRDPLNPIFVGCYTHPDYGGTHDAQCVMYRGPDADYTGREICLNSNGNAFIIADVTNKSNPQTVAVATYPKTAYTHQGWLTDDQNYFYMNDELDEMNKIVDKTRTLIWDVSDLDDPILVKEFTHSVGASDHNLYIKGNLMYQSNYQAGLRILDISDPVNPVESGHFDTAPFSDDTFGFGGSWSNYPYFKSGVIAVSSQAEGLFLVRKRDIDL